MRASGSDVRTDGILLLTLLYGRRVVIVAGKYSSRRDQGVKLNRLGFQLLTCKFIPLYGSMRGNISANKLF